MNYSGLFLNSRFALVYIDYFIVGEWVRFLFTSCEESQTNERVFERVSCDSSQQVNKNRTNEPTMKLFVYFISTEISFKQ